MTRQLQALGGPADGAWIIDPGGTHVYLDGFQDMHGDVRTFALPAPDRGLYARWPGGLEYLGPAAWACECGALLTGGPSCPLCGAHRAVRA